MPLSTKELKAALNFLRPAAILIHYVRDLFFDAGDGETAARLSEISGRLDAERQNVERLLAAKS